MDRIITEEEEEEAAGWRSGINQPEGKYMKGDDDDDDEGLEKDNEEQNELVSTGRKRRSSPLNGTRRKERKRTSCHDGSHLDRHL